MVTLHVEHLVSFLICLSGILSNAISLIYFVKRESSGLINILFILLNTFDLAVCISGSVTMTLEKSGFHGSPAYLVSKTVFSCSIQGTGFVTVLISTCRAIKIRRPFDHDIRGCTVATLVSLMCIVGFGVEISDAVVSENCHIETFNTFRDYKRCYYIVSLLLAVLIILMANVHTMGVLRKKRRESGNDFIESRPTVTITILSTLFCFISVLVLVHLVLLVVRVKDDYITIYFFFYGIPLNSAINPIVYIVRNRKMQLFITSLFCSCRSNELGQIPMRQVSPIKSSGDGLARDHCQLNGTDPHYTSATRRFSLNPGTTIQV